MKKVLEGELLSLAHRVLQMKNKDVNNLLKEAKDIYEKLLILKFYQENFEKGLINDVSAEELETRLDAFYAGKTIETNQSYSVETERHQIPTDLIEEDYPIVVEAEKEVVMNHSDEMILDAVQKIAPEIMEDEEEMPSIEVSYHDTFKEDSFVVEKNTTEIEEFLDELEESNEYVFDEEEDDENELVAKNHNHLVNSEFVHEEESLDAEEKGAEEVDVNSSEINISVFTGDNIESNYSYEKDEALNKKDEVEENKLEQGYFTDNTEDFRSLDDNKLVDSNKDENSNVSEIAERDITSHPMQKEDDPFSGFNFMDLDFQRVDQHAKSDEKKEEPRHHPISEVINSQNDLNIEQVDKEEDNNVENAQNTLFNLESTPVREPKISKPTTINDIYNTTIVVGLNDRIAFEKNLFGGSAEDFNRVLSQLNTVSTFEEAKSLIDHLVRPEYNNWEGKEEFEERFMALVEKRFI
ncbi:hypothetical protein [Myroides injenensis]|uniref:hypothetical protein n=1 Tax=Myroides injenensis TaxID=1183151 RepID=UPI0002891962|nr:hypothetical protein [Myroides injenensis]